MMSDAINPTHYRSNPSGVECIEVAEEFNFNRGNAIKYIWRAGLKSDAEIQKGDAEIQDLNKAVWYLQREVLRLSEQQKERN